MENVKDIFEKYDNKTYSELILIRDGIIEELHSYEKSQNKEAANQQSKEKYKYNLDFIGKISRLIAMKYYEENIWTNLDKNNFNFIFAMKDFIQIMGLKYEDPILKEIEKRKGGEEYKINHHIKAMILAFLSSQQKWSIIEEKIPRIDELFFQYDITEIEKKPADYFTDKITNELHCGNKRIKYQMNALKDNIKVLQNIENDIGSIDQFIKGDSLHNIANILTKPSLEFNYKLKELGESLVWEYFRNVGFDCAKPDTHLRRFFGLNRMGFSKKPIATGKEVLDVVKKISEQTELSMAEIDNIIWSFCADGFGEICTSSPKCNICPIKKLCNNEFEKEKE